MPEGRTVIVFRCAACGVEDASPIACCRRCGASSIEAREVPGEGRLVSWTVVRRPGGQFADRSAFAVALVDLDAGPRVTGNLRDFEREPALGAAVHVVDERDGVAIFEESDDVRDEHHGKARYGSER